MKKIGIVVCNYNKENVISSLKTETFIMTLNALLNLYNDANVICFFAFAKFSVEKTRPGAGG